MVLKRQLIRFAGGVGLLAALGFAALFGFAQYEKWGNPLLPKSSWPTLEAAATDDSGPVQVLVADDVSVNSFEKGIQYCYCDITADPLNPNRLFASSLVETPKARVPGSNAKLSNVAGFYSHDGGKSWTRAFYLVADTGNQDASQRESYSDSTVCWGRAGAVHFAVMHGKGFEPFVPKKARDKPPRKDHRIDFWKSEDAGVSWKQGSGIPFFLDRPFMVVDTTSSPRSGRLYTIANDSSLQIFANEATDLQSRQVEIHEQHFVNARPANPAILRDGTVLFAAEEYNPKWLGRVRPDAARQISTFRCSDGEHVVTGSPINTRWSHDSLDNSGRPLFSFFLRLGANSDSRKFIDHVYCVWAGNRIMADGSRLPEGERVFLSVSRDGGQVWDQPVSLSEQPLGSNPDDDFLTALPTVAVNRDGVVAVSWYDQRGLPKSDSRLMFEGWNVRARISVDGGASWLPSVQLNQSQSQGEFDMGHTQGLTAAADGRFHALWIDSRDGTRQLRTTAFGIK